MVEVLEVKEIYEAEFLPKCHCPSGMKFHALNCEVAPNAIQTNWLIAENKRLAQHSVTLNSLVYQILVELGKKPTQHTYTINGELIPFVLDHIRGAMAHAHHTGYDAGCFRTR